MSARDLSLIIAGVGVSLPIWVLAGWLMNADVHADLRNCRSMLSAAIEGRGDR